MAFDYGSEKSDITNPFKIEGKLKLLAGLLISAIARNFSPTERENSKVEYSSGSLTYTGSF